MGSEAKILATASKALDGPDSPSHSPRTVPNEAAQTVHGPSSLLRPFDLMLNRPACQFEASGGIYLEYMGRVVARHHDSEVVESKLNTKYRPCFPPTHSLTHHFIA